MKRKIIRMLILFTIACGLTGVLFLTVGWEIVGFYFQRYFHQQPIWPQREGPFLEPIFS